jgi:hypothetical protein
VGIVKAWGRDPANNKSDACIAVTVLSSWDSVVWGGGMKIARICIAVLFALVFSFGFASFSSSAVGDAPDKPAAWTAFNEFTVKVTSPGLHGSAIWNGQFDRTSGDLRIDGETSEDNAIKKGKILLIGGRVLALEGNLATPGYEIDALDSLVLLYQYVVRLLSAALPGGPLDITGARAIDFADDKHGIRIGTLSASGFIAPPWRVKGSVNASAPDVVEYDLALTSADKEKPGGQRSLNFSGRLSKIATARLDDSITLDGWTLFWVGPYEKKVAGGTIYDYGATPAPELHKSVGAIRVDIRNKATADDYPGERDASKDFTGFWKEKCEEPVGLQIMHYGTNGEYSIAFCGPGGCGDPGEARKSFISRDKKHYEVVSEDEFVQIGLSGSRTTYHRCTRDTHPVLRYQKQ